MRANIAKKKDLLYETYVSQKDKIIHDSPVIISKRMFYPEIPLEETKSLLSSKSVLSESSILLNKKVAEEASKQNFYKIKHKVKDLKGDEIENPSVQVLDDKYSDSKIVEFIVEIKTKRHMTKNNASGSNLDKTNDDNTILLVETREILRQPENLQQFQHLSDKSLKVSEARGKVVNCQHEIFKDYSTVNHEKLKDLGVNAVSISNLSDKNVSVICHSSLHVTNPDSYMNSIEVSVAAMISKKLNTTVFVTGDSPENDPEILDFIGNKRLVVFPSEQKVFDYYVTLDSGEDVVMRGDLKNRPLERAGNVGEIYNSDKNTFIYCGSADPAVRTKKIEEYCDANIKLLYKQQFDKPSDNLTDFETQRQLEILKIQIDQMKIYKVSEDTKDIESFSGPKLVFYEDKEVSKTEVDSTNEID